MFQLQTRSLSKTRVGWGQGSRVAKKKNLGQQEVSASWAALGVQGERLQNVTLKILADLGSLGPHCLEY